MQTKQFPYYAAPGTEDSPFACLQMVSKYYGRFHSIRAIREKDLDIRFQEESFNGISRTADALGFRTLVADVNYAKLSNGIQLPLIIHWQEDRYAVVYKAAADHVILADPAEGLNRYEKQDFMNNWGRVNGKDSRHVLLLQPKPDFYHKEEGKKTAYTAGSMLRLLWGYMSPYRRQLGQLLMVMLAGSMIMLVLPFLTQTIVDIGIADHNITFVNAILIAQLVLYFSRTFMEFIRGWIMLHLGTRININIISDFLIKIMKLPIAFFEGKRIGDILQRIGDNKRIELFLTTATIEFLFAFFNLMIFGIVLAIYKLNIFLIFLTGSALYIGWVMAFMKARRKLDGKRFEQMSRNQGTLIQLIKGMRENRLHNCEREKRWEWERIQVKLFGVNIKSLALNQYQTAGSVFIYEAASLFITFIAARSVINGDMTLGMMLSVQFILGQLSNPINTIIRFIYYTQDAKLSLERLVEYHQLEDEEPVEKNKLISFPSEKGLAIRNLSFRYEGAEHAALQHIDLLIPEGKKTAIVGASGSGKTTLIKLLLKFYVPSSGDILLGSENLQDFSNTHWRSRCGAVLQDGFIYSDTIAKNIVVREGAINQERLSYAIRMANIHQHISSLPLGHNTLLENGEEMLSQGQKQRLLIARAVYKDPHYLFFDEATNALDAHNEKIIMHNLDEFMKGRTVVVVAHRLSTVKDADQIIVMDKGRIIETGNHEELVAGRSYYFNLIRNQLELGN